MTNIKSDLFEGTRIGGREREYVMEVLEGQFKASYKGQMTARLETLFAKTFNSNYAISFANGTATMHASLAAMDVGPGDEVIVPPLTMSATALACLHAGATPVFADIDPETWTIDPESIVKRLSPQTKAIIPVAIYGLPPDMERIMQIASEHNLGVVEDDAQCFLGSINNKLAGSIAHASSFSFQNSKHMTCGEGGMVTTNDPDLAEKIRRFSNLGYAAVGAAPGGGNVARHVIRDPAYSRHTSIGWNYRMGDLCAAVALGQLERLSELVDRRVAVANLFAEVVKEFPWVGTQRVKEGYTHAFWTYAILLYGQNHFTWQEFYQKFVSLGGDPPYGAWKLTYLEPAFRGQTLTSTQQVVYDEGLCPVAESIQPWLVQLKTNYFDMDEARAQADILREALQYFDRTLHTQVAI